MEQLDEPLPDGPGSAEYADWNFLVMDVEKLILASAENLTTRRGDTENSGLFLKSRAEREIPISLVTVNLLALAANREVFCTRKASLFIGFPRYASGFQKANSIRCCRLGRVSRLALDQVFIGQDHDQRGCRNGDQSAYNSGQRASERKSNDHGERRKIQRVAHDAR